MDLSRLEPNLDLVKGQNIKLFSKREICQKKAIIMINSIWQNCISDWCVVLHFPCHISRVRRIFDDWWGLYSKLNHEISFLCQGETMNLFRCLPQNRSETHILQFGKLWDIIEGSHQLKCRYADQSSLGEFPQACLLDNLYIFFKIFWQAFSRLQTHGVQCLKVFF